MAPKKKEPKAPEVTLEMLIAAAEDFNSFMFAAEDEGIPLDLEFDDLLAEVTETAEELEKTDTIQAATADTLDALDVEFDCKVAEFEEDKEPEEEKPAKKGKDKKAAAKKADPEPEDDGEENSDELDAAKVADIALVKKTKDVEKLKSIAKAWGIRIPPPFYKDIKKLKEYLISKLDGSSPAPEKKAKDTKQKENTIGINDFFESLIPKGLKKDQHEDDVVLLAKEKFPDKPYRVIGNALYAYCRKLEK